VRVFDGDRVMGAFLCIELRALPVLGVFDGGQRSGSSTLYLTPDMCDSTYSR